MTSSKAARRYARALFDLARDEKKLDAVGTDLEALSQLMNASTELRSFLDNYMIPMPRRIQTLGLLFEGHIDPLTFRFLIFVNEKRRVHHLRQMIVEFGRLYDEHQGKLRVTVTTAQDMSDEQANALVARLRDKFKKQVVAHTRLDPSLLGGFRIRVGDWIHDFSIETRLKTLHQKLVNA